MLLPSVLPCENSFRISRSRTSSRLQNQSSHRGGLGAGKDIGALVGLGLSFAPSTPTSTSKHPGRIATSCQALHQIISLEKTPKSSTKRPPPIGFPPATPSPSGSSNIPTPKTPSKRQASPCTPWTTPGVTVMPQQATQTQPSGYTCTVVTRNNKRRRNGESVSTLPDPFVTPATTQTPSNPPPAPDLMAAEFDTPMAGSHSNEVEDADDELGEGFMSPKRSRIRGPKSRRISSTPRSLGPWTTDEDKQLVEMVFAKLKLTERDWAECANTLGRLVYNTPSSFPKGGVPWNVLHKT